MIEAVPSGMSAKESDELFSSNIKLHIFRHDKRDGPDLTPEGKQHAMDMAVSESINQSMAFGSNVERTQHTAALRMTGTQEEITGDETFEELKNKVNSIGKIKEGATKIRVDSRLSFPLFDENDAYSEEFKALNKSSTDKDTFLSSVAEYEPAIASSHGIEKGLYESTSSNIASIILKYIKIAPRFNKLVMDSEKEYSNTLERYMGTHMGVGEFFLMKLIEKTEGTERRNEFAAIQGNGFGPSEGLQVQIKMIEGHDIPQIEVTYEKDAEEDRPAFFFSKIVSKEVIEEIEQGK